MALSIRHLARDQLAFLMFKPFRPDLAKHFADYLGWGLVMTWIAGMGRYWDHTTAGIWQKAGLGSLAYVFLMALLIWLIAAPLKPRGWSYGAVLVFVTLTSAPAILYAIPVEQFMSLGAAQAMNGLFLLVVAFWRVALLAVFLKRAAGLGGAAIVVAALLPLTLIVTVLAMLNLEGAVFEIMGGFQPGTAYDQAYGILLTITLLSYLASPMLVVTYIVLIARARKDGAGRQ